jgi:2-keto-4-pentenoate hydratase/2-oxohepta-3-ene-1,7-dioic acid hydratase in catechol pathway
MRIIRYKNQLGIPQFGWVLEDADGLHVGSIEGSPFSEFRRLEAYTSFEDVRVLAPAQPSKIIGIGRNYAAHAKEHNVDVPEVPLTFLKPPSSVIGPEEAIMLPPQSNQVEHEAELAVVIGKSGRWIPPNNASEYILGYSIANDVTARDLQRSDSQWTRGKGFDTFCSLGPWIKTDFDPADAVITCYVNEEMRQMGSTRDMVFSVNQLIAYISSVMTLEPGDVILTGTPSGVSPLYDGDRVEITIEGLGTLSNPVSSVESG